MAGRRLTDPTVQDVTTLYGNELVPIARVGNVRPLRATIDEIKTFIFNTVPLTINAMNELADGGETPLHYHASDRDRSNHTGTQSASTIIETADKTFVSKVDRDKWDSMTSGVVFKGVWDASTNTPPIPISSSSNIGWFYKVNVAGTTDINGINVWEVGDEIYSTGTVWERHPSGAAPTFHASEHIESGTDAIPNATETSNGLMPSAMLSKLLGFQPTALYLGDIQPTIMKDNSIWFCSANRLSTPPTISPVFPQNVLINTALDIPIYLDDSYDVSLVTLSVTSSDTAFLPLSSMIISGQGSIRNLHFDAKPDVGSSLITVEATNYDGLTYKISFTYSVVSTAFVITATSGSYGNIYPKGNIVVPQGGSITFVGHSDVGYGPESVTIDGSTVLAIDEYTFNNIQANHTIDMTFNSAHTITSSSSANGTVYPYGSIGVIGGRNKTFTFTPDYGCQLDAVYVDGAPIGTPSTYTFNNVSGNHSINAVFSIIPPLTSPENVTFQAIDATTYRISWSNVQGEAGYKVYWSSDMTDTTAVTIIARGNPALEVAKDVTYVDHTGVSSLLDYNYVVVAYNTKGETLNSSVISSNTLPVWSTITIDSYTSNGCTISYKFTDTSNSTGSVDISIDSGVWQSLGAKNQDTIYTYNITSLVGASHTAQFRVADRTGIQVSSSIVPILIPPPIAPANPIAISSNQANTITWTSDISAQSYNIKWGTALGNYPNTINGVTSPYTHNGLTNGQTYYYIITAVNQGGTTDSTLLTSVPANAPSFTSQPTKQSATINSITLAYGTSDTEGDHYRLDYSKDNGITWLTGLIADETPGIGKTCTISSLAAGTTYDIKLKLTPLTGGGTANVSNTVSATTICSAPVQSALTVGSTQLTANWTDVTGETSYNIYYSTNTSLNATMMDGTNVYPASPNATAGKITGVISGSISSIITGLTNNTTYYVRISAVNASGESALSTVKSAIPIGVPQLLFEDKFDNSSIDTTNFGFTTAWSATLVETTKLTLTNGTGDASSAIMYYKTHPALDGKIYVLRAIARAGSTEFAGLELFYNASAPICTSNTDLNGNYRLIFLSAPGNQTDLSGILYIDNAGYVASTNIATSSPLLVDVAYDYELTLNSDSWRYRIIRVSDNYVMLDTDKLSWNLGGNMKPSTVQANRWLVWGDPNTSYHQKNIDFTSFRVYEVV